MRSGDLRLWRIVTSPHPIWSGEGARPFGQRWNPPGSPAIPAGTSFAVCLLEILVHANRKRPPSAARFVEAVVPDSVSREVLDPAPHRGWDDPHETSIGRAWIEQRRSAILFVSSGVTAGRDVNAVVNPDHPDAARISVGAEAPVTLSRFAWARPREPASIQTRIEQAFVGEPKKACLDPRLFGAP